MVISAVLNVSFQRKTFPPDASLRPSCIFGRGVFLRESAYVATLPTHFRSRNGVAVSSAGLGLGLWGTRKVCLPHELRSDTRC